MVGTARRSENLSSRRYLGRSCWLGGLYQVRGGSWETSGLGKGVGLGVLSARRFAGHSSANCHPFLAGRLGERPPEPEPLAALHMKGRMASCQNQYLTSWIPHILRRIMPGCPVNRESSPGAHTSDLSALFCTCDCVSPLENLSVGRQATSQPAASSWILGPVAQAGAAEDDSINRRLEHQLDRRIHCHYAKIHSNQNLDDAQQPIQTSCIASEDGIKHLFRDVFALGRAPNRRIRLPASSSSGCNCSAGCHRATAVF